MSAEYRPTVALDVCGVLCNFVAGALAKATAVTGKTYHEDMVTQWDFEPCIGLTDVELQQVRRLINQPGFCAALPPYFDALPGVPALRQIADVYPVTVPLLNPWWVAERTWWLHEHFGFVATDITYTTQKWFFRADMLIEDKPETLIKWQQMNPQGVGILWDRPYNRDAAWAGVRTQHWEDVLDQVVAISCRHAERARYGELLTTASGS